MSTVIDLFNYEANSSYIRVRPALPQLSNILERPSERLKAGQSPVWQSDKHSQYHIGECQRTVKSIRIGQSMSHKFNFLDNSFAENFLGHLKQEIVRLQQVTILNYFKCEHAKYIHRFNRERIQLSLKVLSPVDHWAQPFARNYTYF